MYRSFVASIALVAAAGGGASAGARAPMTVAPPPAPITRLLACQSLTEAAARLACFDRESAAINTAVSRRDIVVIDRESVRSSRRSLFGLSLPSLAVFGGDDKDELKQIDGVLSGTGRNRDGGYIFKLEDGSRWTQVDDRPFALEPRSGEKVIVKKAAMGSYMLVVARQPGVRVQRLN